MAWILFLLVHVTYSFNYNNHGIDWPGTCNTSVFQSPIDIDSNFLVEVSSDDPSYWSLDLKYKSVHVINLNSTKPVSITSGFTYNPNINFNIFSNFGKISKIQDSTSTTTQYEASSISFHYPAEHTLSKSSQNTQGNHLLEVQITHISTDDPNNTLILSIFFQPSSQKNYFLKQIIDSYYSTIGGDIDCTFATNGWYVVKNFYTYVGSQTIPNCNEGVTWVLLSDIVNSTQSQIDFFATKLNITSFGGNFRYTFPKNGRIVYKHIAGVFSFSLYLQVFISILGLF